MSAPTTRRRNQHGMTLVECVISVAIGSLITAGVCQTLLAYQSGYHRQTARVDRDQQARFALDLMAEEARVAERVAQGPGCAEPGLHLDDARLSFAANLYERTTVLREPVSSGRRSVVVAAGTIFDAHDRIMLVGIGDPADPSDDVVECLKVADRAGDQIDLETPLARSYPTGTRVAVSNQVTYALDDRRGRLMRVQDGASQRVAQDVAAFSAKAEGTAIVFRLEMRAKPGDAPAAWRRLITAHP